MEEKDIEFVILAEILLATNSEQYDAISELSTKDFKDKKALSIYIAMASLLAKKEHIEVLNLFHCMSGEISTDELSRFMNDAYSPCFLPNHISLLKQRNYQRTIKTIATDFMTKVGTLTNQSEFESHKARLMADLLGIQIDGDMEFVDYAKNEKLLMENILSTRKSSGYSFGIKELDDLIGGMEIPRLTVVGALKKAGKTRFVMYLRKQLAEQGIYSPFISLEVPEFEILRLTKSTFCKVNDRLLRTGSLISAEQVRLLKETPIPYDLLPTECISGVNIESVLKRIKRYSVMYPKCVVFIDYLQRIVHDNNNAAKELESMSNMIADATRACNVHIVLLSQLNTQGEDKKKTPHIGDLKGSGGIGESADTIMMLDNVYRRTGNEESKNLFDIYTTQRYGDSKKIQLTSELGICDFQSRIITSPDFPTTRDGKWKMTKSYNEDAM